jgi:hypothetical protein
MGHLLQGNVKSCVSWTSETIKVRVFSVYATLIMFVYVACLTSIYNLNLGCLHPVALH